MVLHLLFFSTLILFSVSNLLFGAEGATLEVTSYCEKELKVYWLDASKVSSIDEEIFHYVELFKIPPREDFTINTFEGHSFLFQEQNQ